MRVLTDRLRAAMDRAARLPVATQEALAEAIEEALNRTTAEHIPPLSAEVRAAFERALVEHAATLEYLKDR